LIGKLVLLDKRPLTRAAKLGDAVHSSKPAKVFEAGHFIANTRQSELLTSIEE